MDLLPEELLLDVLSLTDARAILALSGASAKYRPLLEQAIRLRCLVDANIHNYSLDAMKQTRAFAKRKYLKHLGLRCARALRNAEVHAAALGVHLATLRSWQHAAPPYPMEQLALLKSSGEWVALHRLSGVAVAARYAEVLQVAQTLFERCTVAGGVTLCPFVLHPTPGKRWRMVNTLSSKSPLKSTISP